jgi:hypothetical protein
LVKFHVAPEATFPPVIPIYCAYPAVKSNKINKISMLKMFTLLASQLLTYRYIKVDHYVDKIPTGDLRKEKQDGDGMD